MMRSRVKRYCGMIVNFDKWAANNEFVALPVLTYEMYAARRFSKPVIFAPFLCINLELCRLGVAFMGAFNKLCSVCMFFFRPLAVFLRRE